MLFDGGFVGVGCGYVDIDVLYYFWIVGFKDVDGFCLCYVWIFFGLGVICCRVDIIRLVVVRLVV